MPDSNMFAVSRLYPCFNNTWLDSTVLLNSSLIIKYIQCLNMSENEIVQNCLMADNDSYCKLKPQLPKNVVTMFENAITWKAIKMVSFKNSNPLECYMAFCKQRNTCVSILTTSDLERIKNIKHIASDVYNLNGVIFYYSESRGKLIADVFNYCNESTPYQLKEIPKPVYVIKKASEFRHFDNNFSDMASSVLRNSGSSSAEAAKSTENNKKLAEIFDKMKRNTTIINNRDSDSTQPRPTPPPPKPTPTTPKPTPTTPKPTPTTPKPKPPTPPTPPTPQFVVPDNRGYIKSNPNVYSNLKYSYTLPVTGDKLKADSFVVVLGKEIRTGGQASIYECLNEDGTDITTPSGKKKYVAKIFGYESFSERDYRKILKLIDFQKKSSAKYKKNIVFPESILIDMSGQPVGYIMKKAENCQQINDIIATRQAISKNLQSWTRKDLVRLCVDIVETVHRLHDIGIIIGDISGANILLNPSTYEIYFIDIDSCQIENFNTPVGTPGFYSKEQCVLQEKGYSAYDYSRIKADDNFALAVLLFKILMLGRHPYEAGKILEVNKAYSEQLFGYKVDRVIDENGESGDDFDKRLWRFIPKNVKLMFFFTFSRFTTLKGIQKFERLSGKKFEAKDLKSQGLSRGVFENPFYPEESRMETSKWLYVMRTYERQLETALRTRSVLELNYNCTDSNDVESIMKCREAAIKKAKDEQEKSGKSYLNVDFMDPMMLDLEPERDIMISSSEDFYYYKCLDCGLWFSSENKNLNSSVQYCPSCMSKYYTKCKYCSCIVKKDLVNNDGLCQRCVIHPSPNNTERICPNDRNIFKLTVKEYEDYLKFSAIPYSKRSKSQNDKLNSLRNCPECRGIKLDSKSKDTFEWSSGDVYFD